MFQRSVKFNSLKQKVRPLRPTMNIARVKQIGKIQEQIEMEYKSRRNYPKKWLHFYGSTPWKEMYNQNEINAQIEEDFKDECPAVCSNEGDSYFVSAEMYRSLVAVCRCGRPRRGLHLLKCLQNQQSKYSANNQQKASDMNGDSALSELPATSNGFVGWRQKQLPSYKKWENSMKYQSPVHDMPGKRITTTSYNVLFIG